MFLPGESHGQKSLVGYSPWGRKELETTKRLSSAQELSYDLRWRYLSCRTLGGHPWARDMGTVLWIDLIERVHSHHQNHEVLGKWMGRPGSGAWASAASQVQGWWGFSQLPGHNGGRSESSGTLALKGPSAITWSLYDSFGPKKTPMFLWL